MQVRFIKLNLVFLAVTLILAPLAMKAQSTSPKSTDIHVGVIGGLAAGNYNLNESDGQGDSINLNSAFSGGSAGVQGGVDFNVKGLVVGAVADWSWSDTHFKLNESLSESGTSSGVEEIRSTVKQMTTVRGRVGRHYGHVLPYVHGGLLLADTELTGNTELTGSSSIQSESSIHSGFVVGAGVEYFVARHYSLTTEYGYNHISGINVTNALFGGGDSDAGITATENLHFSTLNVGFNYHF